MRTIVQNEEDSSDAEKGEVMSPESEIAEASPEPLLATVRDARFLLSIGKTQVFQLLRSGVLERRRLNGSTRITMRSIRALAGV